MALSYLDTEDDSMPLPGYDPDAERRRLAGLPPLAADLPAPPAAVTPGAIAPGATVPPDMSRIIGIANPSTAPGTAPIISDVSDAQNKLAQAQAAKPSVPQPKWWQRALAGAVGGLAGYSNAAGRARPIDSTAAVQGIEGGAGYQKKLSDWQNQLAAAQAGAQAKQSNLNNWWKNEQLQNQADLRRAEAEKNRGMADWYSQSRAEQANARQQRAQEEAAIKKDSMFTKGRETDSILFDPSKEQAPDGYITKPSAANPGMYIAVPPRMMKLTPDLAPYAPGYQVGQQIPWSRFQAAQDAANKAKAAATQAAGKVPTNEYEGVLREFTKPDGTIDYAAANREYSARQAARRATAYSTVIPGLSGGQNGGAGGQVSGDDYLRTLPPGTAGQVKAIAEGRAAMPSAATRSQGALQLRNAVFQYDPTYSDQRAQIRRSFTAGTDGRNIGALNTATVHLDQFADAAKAMQNGTFTPGNEIYNRLRAAFGNSAPTNFESLKSAVAGEMANALKGNATDVEIANMSRNLQASNSPQQLANAIETNLHVLGAKLNTYQERYQQLIPGDTVWSPVLPSARGVYQKHGFDPTQGSAPSPVAGGRGHSSAPSADFAVSFHGKTYHFPSQQAADGFKREVGLQ